MYTLRLPSLYAQAYTVPNACSPNQSVYEYTISINLNNSFFIIIIIILWPCCTLMHLH